MSGYRINADEAFLDDLVRGMDRIRLACEAPDRYAFWDVIVLTAASGAQAELYEQELAEAKRQGLLPASTRTLVAPDPAGRRIGSGGATLNALAMLAGALGSAAARARVLLVHAGGDSRRIPWANVFGKCFIPLPLLADPDRPLPRLFEHQLAMTAPFAARMPQGGLVSIAGDVLPLFDAARVEFPADAALVVTAPAALDVASRHGVILPDAAGRVRRLLQKQPPEFLANAGALIGGGAARLDTGIYAFCGQAYRDLLGLAAGSGGLLADLLAAGRELSLYEEMAAALVPEMHADLAADPFGRRLVEALGAGRLMNHTAARLRFLHFGTTGEVLEHLAEEWAGRLARVILSESGSQVGSSTVLARSRLHPGVSVGSNALLYASELGAGSAVGSRCVVVGVHAPSFALQMPDNLCLWQVPLAAAGEQPACVVTACCGVDDNPKTPAARATFCNRDLALWMQGHGVGERDLWPDGAPGSLWDARLFVAADDTEGLRICEWLMGVGGGSPAALRDAWRVAPRLSLRDLHARFSPEAFLVRQGGLTDRLAFAAMTSAMQSGLDRNVLTLAAQLRGLEANRARLIELTTDGGAGVAARLPASRRHAIRGALLRTAGRAREADAAQGAAFAAVQEGVARSVRDCEPPPVERLPPGRRCRVELPVRFDLAGGWSDTPPYCLERPARVLNFAMRLDGRLPVGAEVEALAEPRFELELADAGLHTTIESDGDHAGAEGLKDPFLLLKRALHLAGYARDGRIVQGVRVRTWADVPRGSGLGTSSILSAALVTALQQLAERESSVATVADLVLVLEQRMTTGGGWQDQVGGLVPGVKCIASCPVEPLALQIEPVPLVEAVREEFERRFVVAFTGRDRLAKNVLQIVVEGYLRRDRRVLRAIGRLVTLAGHARHALATGDFDALGEVIREVWRTHQELDPHCSNADVDSILGQIEPYALGAKLAGAGGGGFVGVLARDAACADRVRQVLAGLGQGVRVYDWRLWG